MKELELMTSEEYWDEMLENSFWRFEVEGSDEKEYLKSKIMKLIKLLKDEIPDYSTRFTH